VFDEAGVRRAICRIAAEMARGGINYHDALYVMPGDQAFDALRAVRGARAQYLNELRLAYHGGDDAFNARIQSLTRD